jgi:hypothetical protein
VREKEDEETKEPVKLDERYSSLQFSLTVLHAKKMLNGNDAPSTRVRRVLLEGCNNGISNFVLLQLVM